MKEQIERKLKEASLTQAQEEEIRDSLQLLDDMNELKLTWLLNSTWQVLQRNKTFDDVKLRLATRLISDFRTGAR